MHKGQWVGVVVAALIAASGAAWGQSKPSVSPQQNVHESQQYEQLLCTNPAFRARRVAQECGPLQGSQFYDSCVASFQCNRPPRPVHPRATPPSEKIR
jgi:hypothetical protein